MEPEREYTIDEVESETTCSICYAEFLDPDDLRIHVEQMHLTEESKERFCQFCSSIFSNVENYALHIRDAHLTSLKCCKYCSKAFVDSVLLRKHEMKHYVYVKRNTYSCSQCKDIFTNILDLEDHELKNHDNKLDGIILSSCYSILSSILNIKAPTLLQSLGTNTDFVCNRCSFMARDIHDYLKHLQTLNCQSKVCDKCSNVYKAKKGLIIHMEKHLECHNYVAEKDVQKQCHLCKKEIKALQLKQHLKICKPVKCNLCDIVFGTVYQLSEHQSKEHPLAITLTTCQFCRREFVGTVALEKHVNRTHKGDFHLYKYTCIYCDSAFFKHPKALFAHFFSKHPQVEPYYCKICNKLFRVRKRFTLHIKLDHKSVGIVEFDERYHVFFTDKKSEKPFQPISFFDKADSDNSENKSDTEGLLANNKEKDETDAEQIEQADKETDAEQIAEQTDINTDTETLKQIASKSKKPPKIRFKEQAKSNLKMINMNSDFMSATETEGNQTENDSKSLLPKMKRKRKANMKYLKKSKRIKKAVSETENVVFGQSDMSDDEPLVKVKNRQKMKLLTLKSKWNHKRQLLRLNKHKKKQLTCNVCKKYCYTFQNYNHHRSLHHKNETKKCIKCFKGFKTESELKKHVATEHASSRLTETLRNLLERRKQGGTIPQPQVTMAEKFQKTIKKVKCDNITAKVTLTEMSEKLSVQKFIENFTPDTETKKNTLEDLTVVTMKMLENPIEKPLMIKMTKYNPKPENSYAILGPKKLAMPVRFKHNLTEKHKVSIKLVQKSTTNISNANTTYNEEYYDNDYQEETYIDYEDQTEDKNDSVPDVAHEVMLEGTDEPKPTVIPHKIVIPKLPQEYKQIRIAHLLPEAPFYKIVKVDDVLKQPMRDRATEDDNIKLPSGTKLVNVNPLAHLLDNKSVEKVVSGTRSKYYKPKKNNFEKVIAKALLQLENPAAYPKKRKGSKKSLAVEQ